MTKPQRMFIGFGPTDSGSRINDGLQASHLEYTFNPSDKNAHIVTDFAGQLLVYRANSDIISIDTNQEVTGQDMSDFATMMRHILAKFTAAAGFSAQYAYDSHLAVHIPAMKAELEAATGETIKVTPELEMRSRICPMFDGCPVRLSVAATSPRSDL